MRNTKSTHGDLPFDSFVDGVEAIDAAVQFSRCFLGGVDLQPEPLLSRLVFLLEAFYRSLSLGNCYVEDLQKNSMVMTVESVWSAHLKSTIQRGDLGFPPGKPLCQRVLLADLVGELALPHAHRIHIALQRSKDVVQSVLF